MKQKLKLAGRILLGSLLFPVVLLLEVITVMAYSIPMAFFLLLSVPFVVFALFLSLLFLVFHVWEYVMTGKYPVENELVSMREIVYGFAEYPFDSLRDQWKDLVKETRSIFFVGRIRI